MAKRIAGLVLLASLAACVSREPEPMVRAALSDLPGFDEAKLLPAVKTFAGSCAALGETRFGSLDDWGPLCIEASTIADEPAARAFVETRFDAVVLDGGEGLVTGYYEPVFVGAREPGGSFTAPVLGRPPELVSVDLGSFRDDLKGRRIAGQVENGRLVPYADREAIDLTPPETAEILGYMRPDDLFFLQIQGSGVLDLGDEARRIGYAAQNGHPYKAIGKTLVEEGHMPLEEVTMQSIRTWLAEADPADAARVRASNPSYVFFTDRGPALDDEGPLGTLGIPLTRDVSVAVDRNVVPLGAPVWIAGSDDVLSFSGLTIAQDTGGAIRGANRADLFLGRGDEAGETAGRLKLEAKIAVLIPKTAALPEPQS